MPAALTSASGGLGPAGLEHRAEAVTAGTAPRGGAGPEPRRPGGPRGREAGPGPPAGLAWLPAEDRPRRGALQLRLGTLASHAGPEGPWRLRRDLEEDLRDVLRHPKRSSPEHRRGAGPTAGSHALVAALGRDSRFKLMPKRQSLPWRAWTQACQWSLRPRR